MFGFLILLLFGLSAQAQSLHIRSDIGALKSEVDAQQRRSCLDQVIKGPLKDLEGQLFNAGISFVDITFSDSNEVRTQVMGHIQNAFRMNGWQTTNASDRPENLGNKIQGAVEEVTGILPLGTIFYEAIEEHVGWGKYELKFKISVYYGPTEPRVVAVSQPGDPEISSRLAWKTTFNVKTLEEGRQRVMQIARDEQLKFKLADGEELQDMRIISGPSEAAHRQGSVTFSKTGISQTTRYVGPMLEVTLAVDANGNCLHKVNAGDFGSAIYYFYDTRRTAIERAQKRATPRVTPTRGHS